MRSPYIPPAGPRSPRVGRRRRGVTLWWGLLAAPYLVFLLALGVTRALHEVGYPVSDGFRDGLIQASASWVSASVRVAFLIPSAWLLSRVVHRHRSDATRYRALALQITVVALYVLGIAEVLAGYGYIAEEHPLSEALRIIAGVGTLAVIPLLLYWAVVALRQRRGPTRSVR